MAVFHEECLHEEIFLEYSIFFENWEILLKHWCKTNEQIHWIHLKKQQYSLSLYENSLNASEVFCTEVLSDLINQWGQAFSFW